ncbi:MAG: hypothetical protein ACK4PI_11525 [Tepidisphaerales bacterium]
MVPGPVMTVATLPVDVAFSRSRVRPPFPVFAVVLLISATAAAGLLLAPVAEGPGRAVQRLVAVLVPMGALAWGWFWSAQRLAELKREERELRWAMEAELYRRFGTVAAIINKLLSSPMLSPMHRAIALRMYIGGLVDRRRYAEALDAAERLLAEGVPEELVPELQAIRVEALLREDRLLDADRALAELRQDPAKLGDVTRGLTAVLSMVRDVMTGHPDEALETYARHRTGVMLELGSMVSRADAAAAAAAHQRGLPELAAACWRRATCLESPAELVRELPCLSDVARTYPAAEVPPEFAELFHVERPVGPAEPVPAETAPAQQRPSAFAGRGAV